VYLVTSKHYRDQVLIPIVDKFMKDSPNGTIYMEDGAKSHLGDVKKWKNIHLKYPTFYLPWLPNSPDLNPIEKVWRWIKQELTKLEPYPLTVKDLKAAVQTL
jgi:transposase